MPGLKLRSVLPHLRAARENGNHDRQQSGHQEEDRARGCAADQSHHCGHPGTLCLSVFPEPQVLGIWGGISTMTKPLGQPWPPWLPQSPHFSADALEPFTVLPELWEWADYTT